MPYPPCTQAALSGTRTMRAGEHQPLPHQGSTFWKEFWCLQVSGGSSCCGRKGPKHPISVQDRIPQTLSDPICAPPAAPIGFGLPIPLCAVQAETSVCPGVLEQYPNILHNPYVTASQEVRDLYASWENIWYCPHAPVGMVSAAHWQPKSTLSSLPGGSGVRWSAKGDVLLHPPWCRPKGNTQLTCGSLQRNIWGEESLITEARPFLSSISLSGLRKPKSSNYTVNSCYLHCADSVGALLALRLGLACCEDQDAQCLCKGNTFIYKLAAWYLFPRVIKSQYTKHNHVSDDGMGWTDGKEVPSQGLLKQ